MVKARTSPDVALLGMERADHFGIWHLEPKLAEKPEGPWIRVYWNSLEEPHSGQDSDTVTDPTVQFPPEGKALCLFTSAKSFAALPLSHPSLSGWCIDILQLNP